VSFVDTHGTAGAGFKVFSVGALRMRVTTSDGEKTAKASEADARRR
jgi:hypothetical protein